MVVVVQAVVVIGSSSGNSSILLFVKGSYVDRSSSTVNANQFINPWFSVRFGLSEHLRDNERVFNLRLDDSDRAAIAAVQAKGRDLMYVFGDCGGEYRRPSSRKLQKRKDKDTVVTSWGNEGGDDVA